MLLKKAQRVRALDSIVRLFARLRVCATALREHHAECRFYALAAENKLTLQEEWRLRAVVARDTSDVARALQESVLHHAVARKRQERKKAAVVALEFMRHVKRSGHMVAMLKKYRYTVMRAERFARDYLLNTLCRIELLVAQFDQYWTSHLGELLRTEMAGLLGGHKSTSELDALLRRQPASIALHVVDASEQKVALAFPTGTRSSTPGTPPMPRSTLALGRETTASTSSSSFSSLDNFFFPTEVVIFIEIIEEITYNPGII